MVLRTATVIALSIILSSCTANNTNNSNQSSGQKPNPKFEYGKLVVDKSNSNFLPENSDYIMVPVKLEDGDDNSSAERVLYTNIIFYHKLSGKSHLLLGRKSLIREFNFVELSDEDNKNMSFLILSMIERDTDGDGYLTWYDGQVGYLSDLSGKNLQQITPENTNLINWYFDRNSKTLFLNISRDSNKDNKFTTQDETSFLKVSVNKPGIGSEIISNDIELQNNIKRISSGN